MLRAVIVLTAYPAGRLCILSSRARSSRVFLSRGRFVPRPVRGLRRRRCLRRSMERRGESSGSRSSPTSGMTACHSSSDSLSIGRSCSMHQRTAWPTFSWALRNGTPRSTRYSATSVASMRPSAKPRFAFSSSTSTCARSGGRTEKMSLRQSSVRKRRACRPGGRGCM